MSVAYKMKKCKDCDFKISLMLPFYSFLHQRLCQATLRKDHEGQAVLINCLLRNYLHYSLYDQAQKLIVKLEFPQQVSRIKSSIMLGKSLALMYYLFMLLRKSFVRNHKDALCRTYSLLCRHCTSPCTSSKYLCRTYYHTPNLPVYLCFP